MLVKECKDQFWIVDCFLEQFNDMIKDCDWIDNGFDLNTTQKTALAEMKKELEALRDKYLK